MKNFFKCVVEKMAALVVITFAIATAVFFVTGITCAVMELFHLSVLQAVGFIATCIAVLAALAALLEIGERLILRLRLAQMRRNRREGNE